MTEKMPDPLISNEQQMAPSGEPRREWKKPTLRHFRAGEARGSSGTGIDAEVFS